jgi:osmotically-inducible protein OsmY
MKKITTLMIAGVVGSTLLLQSCVPIVVAGAATGAVVARDRRTMGSFVDDQGIEVKAGQELASQKKLYQATHISFTSYNGIVLITGEAPTHAMRARVENIVRDIPRVRRIYNEIEVIEPISVGQRTQDTWTTTKVKTNLFVKSSLDPSRIKVVTSNGVVYLMGIVTRNEATIATESARANTGVEKVVKIFEYTDN